MLDRRSISRFHVHTARDQVGESRREWREINDAKVVGAESLPCGSTVGHTDVGRNFKED